MAQPHPVLRSFPAERGLEPAPASERGALELMAHVSRGRRAAQLALLDAVGACMERTLHRLLGCDAPLEPLLEAALLRALNLAPDYAASEPLALWADRIAVQVATEYLSGPRPVGLDPARAGVGADPSSVRALLGCVQWRLRRVRPEEHVAFALLDLDGRSLLEASRLTGAAPIVVRQRAERARRHLLFAARRDRTIAAYLQLSERLRALAARLQRNRPGGEPRRGVRRLHESVVSALHAAQT